MTMILKVKCVAGHACLVSVLMHVYSFVEAHYLNHGYHSWVLRATSSCPTLAALIAHHPYTSMFLS